MNNSLATVFLVLIAATANAGVQMAWTMRFRSDPNRGTNYASAIAIDRDQNVIVAGSSSSASLDLDYQILKLSPSGTLIWSNRFASPAGVADDARALVVDSAGSAIIGGTSRTVKFRATGEIEWVVPIPANAMAIDGGGSVYLTAYSPTSFSVTKVAANGTSVWERTFFVLNGPDFSQRVALDAATNVYLSGWCTCYDFRVQYRNRLLVSFDREGAFRWATQSFPEGCANAAVNAPVLVVDHKGNVTASRNTSTPPNTFATRSYDSNGGIRWDYYLEAAIFIGYDGVRAGVGDLGANTYLVGATVGPGGGQALCGTVKLGPTGSLEWLRQFGDAGFTAGNAIALDSANNVYVTGTSSNGPAAADCFTIKYSPDGQQQWVQRYNGPAHRNDVATCMAVTPSGEVYVAGWSQASSNLTELIVIKYAELTNLQVGADRRASLQFFGTPGQRYRIDTSTNLPNWEPLGEFLADPAGIYRYVDTNAPNHPWRFYRTGPP